MRFRNKVALITGAASGMGASMARIFAREGAKVAIADMLEEEGRRVASEITQANGAAIFYKLDVTSETEWRGAIDATVAAFGKLDILVNDAGISGSAVEDLYNTEAWERLMAVNATGTFLGMKLAIPIMRQAGGGSIVNISSLAAWEAYPLVGYKTMKAAVLALTANLAAANARHGVRVNAILPGLMNTPMAIEARVAQGTPRAEVIAAREKRVPLGHKMGTAWDVAYAALFLHSDEAGFVSGAHLPVDGATAASFGSYD